VRQRESPAKYLAFSELHGYTDLKEGPAAFNLRDAIMASAVGPCTGRLRSAPFFALAKR
jgi:hypothetical protein